MKGSTDGQHDSRGKLRRQHRISKYWKVCHVAEEATTLSKCLWSGSPLSITMSANGNSNDLGTQVALAGSEIFVFDLSRTIRWSSYIT